MFSRILCLAALAAGLFSTACAKHVQLTPAQNIQLSAGQALDVLAHADRAAETSVLQLNASKLLSDSLTREIQGYIGEVATAVQNANKVNQSGLTVEQRTAGVIAALQGIPQLPAGVQTFLNNPAQQGQVVALAGLLRTVVELIQAVIKPAAPKPVALWRVEWAS